MIDYLNSLNKLEFPKVKNYIKKYSISDLANEKLDLLQPSGSLLEIRNNLDLTTETKKLLESDDPLPLDGLTDIRISLNRAKILDNILTNEEIYKIGTILKISRKITSYFNKRKNLYPLLYQLIEPIYIDKILEYNIDSAIDDNGNVRDTASAELKKIRRELNLNIEHLRKKLDTILKSISSKGWAQEEIITTRDGRMVIPVKIENKNRVPGFVHSLSSSGATVFIEPAETLEMNNEIRSLHFQEIREISKILKDLTDQIRNVVDNLKENVEILGTLDFLQAKAKYSIEILGCAPRIKDNSNFLLVDGYHPILLMRHNRKEVIPLTIELGKDYYTLIITGPNAGGKSVAIKTFGLLVMMAQAGLHIPASFESEFSIYEKLFVDIGDEQSIEDDLSTFSSHLANLKVVIESSDNKSLILIDEIAAGTDPTEGSAIAEALLEKLTSNKSHTLVTTHHGTLKAFAHETPGIENGAMEFDHVTLMPTYRFKSGIPGSSYALEMAKRMGLPDYLIKRSDELRGSGQHSLENLLSEIENQSQQIKKELEIAAGERIKLEQLINEYSSKNKSLQKEIKEIKSKALLEAKSIIDKANTIIERSVQEIKEDIASKESIKKAKSGIAQLKEEHENLLKDLKFDELEKPADVLKIGDKVKIKEGTEIGEIIEIIDGNYLNVLFGQLKIKTSKNEVVKVVSNKEKTYSRAELVDISPEGFINEIDLRGMLGEEAITAVDKFIDNAILLGLHRVDIIHGKGTGALQKKISEYLKKHPSVKSFRFGEWNEGGRGVTVAELK